MQKLLGFLICSFAILAQANSLQSQKIQLQCKAKAKEVAQSTYTSCLNEAREAELEKVKQDYKEKLDKLKSYYDKKIKTLSPDNSEIKTAGKTNTQDFPTLPSEKKNKTEPTEEFNTDSETN
jgi:hypothetical protein